MGKTIEIIRGLGWRREQIEIVTAKFPPADAWTAPSSAWVQVIKRDSAELSLGAGNQAPAGGGRSWKPGDKEAATVNKMYTHTSQS